MLADLGPSVTAMSTSIERASVETRAGDFTAAERELRADDASLAELGERYFRSTVVGMLAGVLVEAHRFEEAEAFVETARELADDDDTLSQVLWRTAWARILAESGRAEEAIAVVERAVEIAAEGDDIVLLGDAKSARGEVLWRTGRQKRQSLPAGGPGALRAEGGSCLREPRQVAPGGARRRGPDGRRLGLDADPSVRRGAEDIADTPHHRREDAIRDDRVAARRRDRHDVPVVELVLDDPIERPTTTISHSRYGSCGGRPGRTVAIWPVHAGVQSSSEMLIAPTPRAVPVTVVVIESS